MNLKNGKVFTSKFVAPGPRLMKWQFTGLRSYKGWETLLQIAECAQLPLEDALDSS